MFDRQRLLQLVQDEALEFGDFTLASGQKASFYLDCRKLTLTGEGATLIADGMLELMAEDMPDLVGGMAIGADPITAAIITRAWSKQQPLRGFIVRKEAKEHGKGRQVEGPIRKGDRAVIVEDVVTTGGSSLRAIEAARGAGLKIDRIIAIVDRGEDSKAVFGKVDVEFRSLFHLSELKTEA